MSWSIESLDIVLSAFARIIPILVLAEVFWLLWRSPEKVHLKDTFYNASNGIILRFVDLLIWTPFFFLVHELVRPWAISEISLSHPASWLVLLLLTDLTYYWFHRLSHFFPLLWAFHESHHSTVYMNWLASFRINWGYGWVRALSHLPLTLIGFPPRAIYFSYIVILLYQVFVHSDYMRFPRVVSRVFNSPQAHCVHHSLRQEHHDTNFGGILIVWDRIFGTYIETEQVPERFGVEGVDGTRNPFVLNFKPVWQLLRRAWLSKNLVDALGVFVLPESRSQGPSREAEA